MIKGLTEKGGRTTPDKASLVLHPWFHASKSPQNESPNVATVYNDGPGPILRVLMVQTST